MGFLIKAFLNLLFLNKQNSLLSALIEKAARGLVATRKKFSHWGKMSFD